jgi:serine kinase of HPr protein (carbohydrate metabolism regulator)
LIRHAGLVALRLGERWRGALIEGASGSGKSDLILRAVEGGFRLVADDRTVVWSSGGMVFGRAPDPLGGLIEVRGQGVLLAPSIGMAEILLVIRCVTDASLIERMPQPASETLAGTRVALRLLDAREPSAPAKMRSAMQHLGAAAQQAYLASLRRGGDRTGTGETH